jgi:hypothetical protein
MVKQILNCVNRVLSRVNRERQQKWIDLALKTISQASVAAIAGGAIAALPIGNAEAQVANTLVYVLGNNPYTFDLTRQVVTNPAIASVNGRTSIIAGTFDPQTADYVTRELQRRGVAAQQLAQTTTVQPIPIAPVTLTSYLPNTTNNLDNPSRYRYVTAVPMSAGGMMALAQVQRFVPRAFISKSFRGDYIYAGGYTNRDGAESLKHFLRSQGLDARVLYF